MSESELPLLVFRILHPHWMGGLSVLLSAIYFFKFMCVFRPPEGTRNQMYLLRSGLWLTFGLVWFAFPYINLILSRALLRIMVTVIITTEIAYNLLYIKDAITGTVKWILKK